RGSYVRRDAGRGASADHRLGRAHLVRVAIAAARSRGIAVGPSRPVIVGDTVHDVRGALDAGARCVGVATGLVGSAQLAAAGAHAVLSDLTDAEALLAALDTAGHAPAPCR